MSLYFDFKLLLILSVYASLFQSHDKVKCFDSHSFYHMYVSYTSDDFTVIIKVALSITVLIWYYHNAMVKFHSIIKQFKNIDGVRNMNGKMSLFNVKERAAQR